MDHSFAAWLSVCCEIAASTLGVSSAAIKRMEEAGVIQANVALVDPAQVGQPITIFVEVEMESEGADLIDAAKREANVSFRVIQTRSRESEKGHGR